MGEDNDSLVVAFPGGAFLVVSPARDRVGAERGERGQEENPFEALVARVRDSVGLD